MKTLLIGLLTMVSVTAMAHPWDTDFATAIDLGSILKVERDINIPRVGNVYFMERGTEFRWVSAFQKKPYCSVYVLDKESKPFSRDVLLKSGQLLTVVKREYVQKEIFRLIAETALGNKVHFLCIGRSEDGTRDLARIQDLKDALGDAFTLELAAPMEI